MKMLIRLLLLERWRKLDQNYGWTGYASTGLALAILGWAGADFAAGWIHTASANRLEALTLGLWTSWVVSAILTGKDLSWQIRLERLRIFPSPGFFRLYGLIFVLGFLSIPILAGMVVFQYWAAVRQGFHFPVLAIMGIGYLLFAASAKASASLGRNCLLLSGHLTPGRKILGALTLALLIGATVLSMKFSGIGTLHPGRAFGLLLSEAKPAGSILWMGLWAAVLIVIDASIRFDLHYAGMPRTLMGNSRKIFGALWEAHLPWPGPLLRIALLGWLRTRSALLLFLWGSLYSFLWTCHSRPKEIIYFYGFIFMNLLFHSHLRANLLGTDQGGAWVYYSFPAPVERALSAKSCALSLLQICMIASLLAAALFLGDVSFTAADWCGLLTYASSGIFFGEICGFFLSIRFPHSVDRTAQFDGGSPIGALLFGVIQALFFLVFLATSAFANRHFASAGAYGLLLTLPLCLCALRHLLLKIWIHEMMLNKPEVLLKKLQWE